MYGQLNNYRQERGTVLILCVALLVILGMVASSFVILSHAQRASSRSLTKADQLEQVRQMSLEYVRTILLEDLVGNDGIFLNGAVTGETDEAFDTPRGADDPWLSYHTQRTDGEIDTDNDTDKESWWINSPDLRFPGFASFAPTPDLQGNANIIAPDGTKYRVAIRIVDTNGLANINVGMGQSIIDLGSDPDLTRKKWDGEYPAYLYLNDLLTGTDSGASLDNGVDIGADTVDGRISGRSSNMFIALTYELYPHLGNNNYADLAGLATPQDYIRPFDVAEELALRMMDGPGTDLNGRLDTLWPSTFSSNSHLLTAYSWTMQIRPPTASAGGSSMDTAIDTALANVAIGYPAPCKIPLTGLVQSDGSTVNKPACTAVYLALLATGMTANNAAQFMVNLVDYIDNDAGIRVINPTGATPTSDVIDFSLLAAALQPTNAYYGTDNQPIISEVYCYRYYDGVQATAGPPPTYNYTLNPTTSRYAVELFNPSEENLVLNGWKVQVETTPTTEYAIPNGTSFPKKTFLTIVSDSGGILLSRQTTPRLFITLPPGPGDGSQTVKLLREGPAGASEMVTVDRFTADNFAPDPPDGGTVQNPTITEDAERPGRTVPFAAGNVPTIAEFGPLGTTNTLGTYPNVTIAKTGEGGQIIVRNRALHSLGELFYIPIVANTTSSPAVIVEIEDQPDGDSNYRLDPGPLSTNRDVLQYLTLRTGIKDGADNDGDGEIDDSSSGSATEKNESIVAEARVPGLINVNTTQVDVVKALHYYCGSTYSQQVKMANWFITPRAKFDLIGAFANFCTAWPSKDEDPDVDSVGSPDGITVDNEEKLFHFTNVANLISVRSDVFVVYITIQASDRDGVFQPNERIMRTMAIVDRSFCLRPQGTTLADIPLPRIVAQTILP